MSGDADIRVQKIVLPFIVGRPPLQKDYGLIQDSHRLGLRFAALEHRHSTVVGIRIARPQKDQLDIGAGL